MKIRTGFVSNSSASSFLVYGCYVKPAFAKFAEDFIKNNPTRSDLKRLDVGCGEDERYIGVDPCLIKDNETGLQFKNSVESIISEMLEVYGKKNAIYYEKGDGSLQCGYITESWLNG